jgi:hypothetical protein
MYSIYLNLSLLLLTNSTPYTYLQVRVPAELVATGGKSVRVSFALDKHGCLYVQSAQLMDPIIQTPEESKDGAAEGIFHDNYHHIYVYV